MSVPPDNSFTVIETTIQEIHEAMQDGKITATALIERYRERIEAFDEELNAILQINGAASERARELDSHFDTHGFVGPLHGVPLILKDNHDTHDFPTTAGAAALAESRPSRDAFVVTQLREAGAIVLAKANLHELAYGVDTISSLGGVTRNAYDLQHRPSGSSGGTAAAIAANLGTIGTGTDTCSSVRSPPAFNNLVGVRPTRGLVSRTGIVPVSDTQDTVGPIARTVADAARVLEVIAGFDPDDPITARGADRIPSAGYTAHCDAQGLKTARIGVAREFFGLHDGDSAHRSDAAAVTAVIENAIEVMNAEGATIIDPVDPVNYDRLQCARVLEYEFARDFDRYLSELGDEAPVETLAELVDTGTLAAPIQARLDGSKVLSIDKTALDENLRYLRRLHRRETLKKQLLSQMIQEDLDAILYPPSTIPPVKIPANQPFVEMNCELAAHTGLPAIVIPAGFTKDGLPVGVELLGREFDEARLFQLAYSFEQATSHRRNPDQFVHCE